MRRWIGLLLAMALALNCCAALAEGLPPAANLDAHKAFERYQSYKLTDGGDWSAHDLQAAQLLRTVSTGAARSYMGNGALLLYPSVRGNALLGLSEVVLNVCLLKSEPIGADSVSIATAGTRYDFVAASKKEKIGAYACERFELPLDVSGMAMLRDIAAEGCAVSIYGGARVYRTTIAPGENAGKAKFEASSLDAIQSLLDELDAVSFGEYALWDLNEGYWLASRPKTASVALSGHASDALPKLDALDCLAIEDRAAVRAVQQLLTDNAFYAGRIDGQHGADTRAAIHEAQQFFGLLQTGQADRVLIERLSGVEPNDTVVAIQEHEYLIQAGRSPEAATSAIYRLDGVAEVRLDRRWFARKLTPTKNDSTAPDASAARQTAQPSVTTTPKPSPTPTPMGRAAITPKNESNVLLVCDGWITNLSAETIFLPMNAQAELTIDERFSYDCTIRCEQDDGKAFGSELLPLESTRLVIYAEVPETVANNRSCALRLVISASGEKMEITFDR